MYIASCTALNQRRRSSHDGRSFRKWKENFSIAIQTRQSEFFNSHKIENVYTYMRAQLFE
jgi:hypothetical protein